MQINLLFSIFVQVWEHETQGLLHQQRCVSLVYLLRGQVCFRLSASLQDRWREEAVTSGQLVARLLDPVPDDSEVYTCDSVESAEPSLCLCPVSPRLRTKIA